MSLTLPGRGQSKNDSEVSVKSVAIHYEKIKHIYYTVIESESLIYSTTSYKVDSDNTIITT